MYGWNLDQRGSSFPFDFFRKLLISTSHCTPKPKKIVFKLFQISILASFFLFLFFMDFDSWSSSGIKDVDVCSKYSSFKNGEEGASSVSILACRSKTSRWRLLWRKLMKEKKKIFDCTSPVQLPYDPYTYSQNFDDRCGSMHFDDLDIISRSFSARFAVPARVFVKNELVV